MPLNDMRLTARMLADFYGDSLVDLTAMALTTNPIAELPKTEAANNEWNFLGSHKKNILLIVRYDDCTYLPDEQLNFLTAVLAACKLGLADVAILNIAKAPSAYYKDVRDKFRSTVVILFGITPLEFQMPVDFPQFQVQKLTSSTFLCAPGLEELERDRVLKSKLWVCLRRIFELP